jgi:hypothetical protein
MLYHLSYPGTVAHVLTINGILLIRYALEQFVEFGIFGFADMGWNRKQIHLQNTQFMLNYLPEHEHCKIWLGKDRNWYEYA